MVSDLIDRASEYCRRRERELLLQNKLGSGVHGSVFACRHHYDLAGRNAVKVFERPEPYLRERDVYLRLRGLGIDNINTPPSYAVPRPETPKRPKRSEGEKRHASGSRMPVTMGNSEALWVVAVQSRAKLDWFTGSRQGHAGGNLPIGSSEMETPRRPVGEIGRASCRERV